MTEEAAAAGSSIPPVTGGDDRLLRDPLLQLITYIDIESNVNIETATPYKGVIDEGMVSNLTPVPAPAEMVMPVRSVNQLAKANLERPSWLPEDWRLETKVRTNGATVGVVDKYYYEPVSGSKFRSKKEVLYFLETGVKRKKANTGSVSEATPSENPKSKKQKKSGLKTKKDASFYVETEAKEQANREKGGSNVQ